MTDEEFNKYCAEAMGLVIKGRTGDGALWVIEPHRHQLDGWFYNPAKEIGHMAEVFDKLWHGALVEELWLMPDTENNLVEDIAQKGIAQAMREYIESTKKEES